MTRVAALALALAATPLAAEVTDSDDRGFITRDEAVVETNLKETWLALISPARWWNAAHTWSGDSENLSLRPQAGGCFCERIPEDPDPDKISLEGSVEHMRVIHAFPEKALRMQGALGPLQSEPVTGILTVVLSEIDEGTRIVWEYNVGGSMRYKVPEISKAVDGVMSQQLNGLAKMLGRVDVAAVEEAPEKEEVAVENDGESDGPNVDEAFGDLADG
ncbi:SRPBCC family protein [uncultured Erythrobacter sp.]|uniref:SRPBCC family protein n=1 Tax=uncultured Erythrobacter sp. TaxID=263913 RepID=UPI0026183169|nr:SRPBCC family protein [uncultured Erythrobacter sp.]